MSDTLMTLNDEEMRKVLEDARGRHARAQEALIVLRADRERAAQEDERFSQQAKQFGATSPEELLNIAQERRKANAEKIKVFLDALTQVERDIETVMQAKKSMEVS